MFSFQDVRAARNQIRWQAGRYIGDHLRIGEGARGRQIRRGRRPQQQLQGIAGLLQLALVGFHVDARGFDLTLGLAEIQFIAGARIKERLVEVVGGLDRDQRALGQRQQLLGFAQHQVLGRDLAHQ